MDAKSIQRNPNFTGEHEAWFWAGVEVGMRRLVDYVREGQYVGETGGVLRRFIREIDAEAGVECWHPSKTFSEYDNCSHCDRCGLPVE